MATTKKSPLAVVPGTGAIPCRIPVATAVLAEIGLDPSTWAVLTDSIFPSANTAEGIVLAVRYCQARGLDIMKRPVHVVPMWSSAKRKYVETIWPGIAEVQITAARTGLWAGLDSPKFGPDQTKTFAGTVMRDEQWVEAQATVTFPEWAEVRVYRLVNGVRCPFSEMVFWEEAYARQGKSPIPNEMWQKRPRGQLLKCAKAASLRAAFPEEAGEYTAEEMAGKVIEADSVPMASVIDTPPVAAQATVPTVRKAAGTVSASVDQPATETISPTDQAKTTAIDEAVQAQIKKLVGRATATKAWGQAEDYARSHFTGEHLTLALNELGKAAAAAVAATQAEEAQAA
ncbi:phage recombination protein Bet [uncultured Lamprocystis sp.]|jgi:phage recombination protein Bet|uniref:phage recombination protein Bet n=1 Tax=uncultured Lamprocystis sp. TaxID=543132 RepID=UPI0025EFEF07|nr:phage recombination protein Bet [uncultured Lamprocystis sp.]